jgi:hypothetical protein
MCALVVWLIAGNAGILWSPRKKLYKINIVVFFLLRGQAFSGTRFFELSNLKAAIVNKTKTMVSLACALMSASCAAGLPSSESVVCTDRSDCDSQWSKAVAWVTSNSYYRVQTQTEQMIQTYGPDPSAIYTAYTVNRIENSDGSGSIEFRAYCANEFGCTPQTSVAADSFADALGQ